MKRFIKAGFSIITAAAIAASASAVSFATQYMGDVNDNGTVDSSDALEILMYSVDISPEKFNLKKADLNGDGAVNSFDALQILRTSVGLAELVEYTEEEEPEKDPTLFTKEEMVQYYNNALKAAYASENLTVHKTTAIEISNLKLSALNDLAGDLIKKYAVPTDETKTFNSDPQAAEKFLVPTALESEGAKSASITGTESGYKVTITLVEEKVDYKTAPKYNSQASVPLTGIAKLAKDYNVTVKSSSLDYTGTVITAEMDKSGKILSLNQEMYIDIKAQARYGIMNITGSGLGHYTLNADFTY